MFNEKQKMKFYKKSSFLNSKEFCKNVQFLRFFFWNLINY